MRSRLISLGEEDKESSMLLGLTITIGSYHVEPRTAYPHTQASYYRRLDPVNSNKSLSIKEYRPQVDSATGARLLPKGDTTTP
jgi:hypothetical protein